MHNEMGWLGMILFLVAYGLVANKKLDSSGIPYNAMNIAGALAIAYSLLPMQAWSTIALEFCVTIIGLFAIYTDINSRSTTT